MVLKKTFHTKKNLWVLLGCSLFLTAPCGVHIALGNPGLSKEDFQNHYLTSGKKLTSLSEKDKKRLEAKLVEIGAKRTRVEDQKKYMEAASCLSASMQGQSSETQKILKDTFKELVREDMKKEARAHMGDLNQTLLKKTSYVEVTFGENTFFIVNVNPQRKLALSYSHDKTSAKIEFGEDDLYLNKSLWEDMPRGFVEIKDKDGKVLHQASSFRKFTYHWNDYLSPVDGDVEIYPMKKEGGSSAHISAFEKDDQLFWCFSTKKKSFIVRDGYITEDCNNTAYNVMEKNAQGEFPLYGYLQRYAKMWEALLGRKETKKEDIKAYLRKSKCALVAEAILEGDEHLEKQEKAGDYFKFVGMTAQKPSTEGLSALAPKEALETLKSFGLDVTEMDRPMTLSSSELDFQGGHITSEAYKKLVSTVEPLEDTEGRVIYAVSGNKVVGMWKLKSMPYNVERLVREYIKSGFTKQNKNKTDYFTAEKLEGRMAQKIKTNFDNNAHARNAWTNHKKLYNNLLVYYGQNREALTADFVHSNWVTVREGVRGVNSVQDNWAENLHTTIQGIIQKRSDHKNLQDK